MSALYRFVESASKGPWWTKLRSNPQYPHWGAKTVHVYICDPGWGVCYSVSYEPKPGSQLLNVGAEAAEIRRVVKLLEETNEAS